MALPATKRIDETKVVALVKPGDTTKFLRQAVKEELSKTALDEVQAQIRLKNKPSSVVLDRRAVKLQESDSTALKAVKNLEFVDARRLISWQFHDSSVIYEAVAFAWRELMSLTRRKTGAARGTYYFYGSDPQGIGGRVMRSLIEVKMYLEKAESDLTSIRILGPTTEYRRKIIYNPRGRQLKSGKIGKGKQSTTWANRRSGSSKGKEVSRVALTNRLRTSGSSTKAISDSFFRAKKGSKGAYFQVQVARAIQEMVVNKVRRQFKQMWVGYRFVRSVPALPHEYGRNIPELYIGLKGQGRF